ncbi:hypothetical protein Sama_2492 [Shewanella amazonensis SB2B]|uniref:Uncharacterized protein n=1 Tax=Shewanella amazonensis (strain ATCC BAA-1098 / SB2B) TaxID=326297 RepID=A1S8I9_SHEAM|nr:hypothetical protein [Shewanella amazonensis]ABM00696.1 hypothetical protein Sama_2492 [Shewanella amazonensis SB2B]
MKMAKIIGVSAAMIFGLSTTAVLAEDFDTEDFPLVFLEINTTSADKYLQYHGKALTKISSGVYEEYRWGGASCGSRVLNDEQVAVLQRALDNPNVKVAFRYQPGQGEFTKCVVGFSLVRKGYTE